MNINLRANRPIVPYDSTKHRPNKAYNMATELRFIHMYIGPTHLFVSKCFCFINMKHLKHAIESINRKLDGDNAEMKLYDAAVMFARTNLASIRAG